MANSPIGNGSICNRLAFGRLFSRPSIAAAVSTFLIFFATTLAAFSQEDHPNIDMYKIGILADENSNGAGEVGETVQYIFMIVNAGDVELTNIQVTDPLVTVTGGPLTLPPQGQDFFTFSAVVTITEDHILAGRIENRATVTAQMPDGTTITELSKVSPDDPDPYRPTVVLLGNPGIILQKTARHDDANLNGLAEAGETVTYEFTVRNTGTVELTNVQVTDPMAPVTGGPLASLAAGGEDSTTFSAVHTITQSDINNGLENQARVTAQKPDGGTVEDLSDDPNDLTNEDADGNGDPDDKTVLTLPAPAEIVVTQTAPANYVPGLRVTFEIAVSYPEGDGPPFVEGLVVDVPGPAAATGKQWTCTNSQGQPCQPFPGPFSGGINETVTLTKGETFTYTFSMDVPESYSDPLVNTATATNPASAPDPVPANNSSTVTLMPGVVEPLEPFPACDSSMYLMQGAPSTTLYDIDTASNPFAYTVRGVGATAYNAAGFNPSDNFIYAIRVGTNNLVRVGRDGRVELLGPVAGLPVTNFPAGEFGPDGFLYVKQVQRTATLYKVNVETREAETITLSRSLRMYDFAWHNGLLYGKDGQSGPGAIGETDLVSVDPVTGVVTDIGLTRYWTLGAMFGAPNGVFGVANDGGFYKFNLETGEATEISGAPSSDNNDGAKCWSAPIEFITDVAVNIASNKNAYVPGEEVTYTITVSNSGPFGAAGLAVDYLLPAGITDVSWTCTAEGGASCGSDNGTGAIEGEEVGVPVGGVVTYQVTMQVPADFSGDLVNTVTATNPADAPDSDTSNNTSTSTILHAKIELVKTGEFYDENGNGLADVGEPVDYTFRVTNTSDTGPFGGPLIYNISVSDPLMDVEGTAPPADTSPGNGATFHGTYLLTQQDIDRGYVENQATARAETDGGTELLDLSDDPNDTTEDDPEGDGEPDDPTVVPLPRKAELNLVKTGTFNDENGNGFAEPGETIGYTFTVENKGNVELSNVTVTDAKVTVTGGPIATLAAGATDSTTFTATYTLTADDLAAGQVENTAAATATDPTGEQVTAESHPEGGAPGNAYGGERRETGCRLHQEVRGLAGQQRQPHRG